MIRKLAKSFGFMQQRFFSYKLCNLQNRSLLRLEGAGADEFLQGLITQDIRALKNSKCALPVAVDEAKGESLGLYSLLLNVQGRVIADCLIYRENEENVLLECDAKLAKNLYNHFRMYKLKRKVTISEEKDLKVSALIPQGNFTTQSIKEDLPEISKNTSSSSIICLDPRKLPSLGFRIVSNQTLANFSAENDDAYTLLRYQLGVGEGCRDHPMQTCFPFETNVDYLNGISFEKGCYLGQELTARTYHTGVVRKRIMPVQLLGIENESFPEKATIETERKKIVGKLLSYKNSIGLGLMRISDSLAAEDLSVSSKCGKQVQVKVTKPEWWSETSV